MRAKKLSGGEGGSTFALVFDSGDEAVDELTGWCRSRQVMAARLTGVGAFSEATVAWFDWEHREYREVPIQEQVELLALNGDVAEQDGQPAIHVHVVLGKRDGTAWGGHLMRACVRPTLELIVDEVPVHLQKRHDPETGLALIALDN
jgi:hypothetical protein